MRIGGRAIGIILVIGGIVYLLEQLGLLHQWGFTFTPSVIWPLLFMLAGLFNLGGMRRGKVPLFGVFLIVFGALLVLRNSRLVPILGDVNAWALFWALVLVFAGFAMILPKQRPKFRVQLENHEHTMGPVEFIGTYKDWKHARKRHNASWKWIGDISVGRQPWTLKDTELWNAVGDVRVNLATATVEDGTWHVQVGGWIGDVRILVPEGLPVLVNASVSLGDLSVFDDNHSGTGRHFQYVDPKFDSAEKRVVISVDLKIGDVQIVRV